MVRDPALEAKLTDSNRYSSHWRFPTKVATIVMNEEGIIKFAACVCGDDVYGVHCRHVFCVLLKKFQLTHVKGTLLKPHPVTMQLSDGCQQVILKGDATAVAEQLAIVYLCRAAIAMSNTKLRFQPHPCGTTFDTMWHTMPHHGVIPVPHTRDKLCPAPVPPQSTLRGRACHTPVAHHATPLCSARTHAIPLWHSKPHPSDTKSSPKCCKIRIP